MSNMRCRLRGICRPCRERSSSIRGLECDINSREAEGRQPRSTWEPWTVQGLDSDDVRRLITYSEEQKEHNSTRASTNGPHCLYPSALILSARKLPPHHGSHCCSPAHLQACCCKPCSLRQGCCSAPSKQGNLLRGSCCSCTPGELGDWCAQLPCSCMHLCCRKSAAL